MAKVDTILSIDIGGDSLKLAEFTYPAEGKMILEKFAFAEYGGDLKEDQQLASLAEVFKKTMAENSFTAKKAYLSISGQSAFVRFVKLPPVGEEESKVRQIVELEAKQNIPFPMDAVIWDYQLIKSSEADAEIEVVFVVVKNDDVKEIAKIVEDCGLSIELIEVAHTASFNSARANGIGQDDCEMILNIGCRCSTLVFIDSGRFFVRPIPIAGYSITQQISKEFGIPFADAEEMKRRHGFVALGGAYEEPDSEVAATVSKIVRNVMTRLHGEINRSINVYRSQQKGRKPAKLWLAGGSSVMAFTPRFFSEKLRIPVDYFNAFQVVALAPEINKESLAEVAHMFSEVIGLGLRHSTVCPIEISLLPNSLRKINELKQKVPYFYATAVSIILCLGILFWAFHRQAATNGKRAEMARNIVNETTLLQKEVLNADKELKNIEKEYETAKRILNERSTWPTIINELQKLLPDKTWLTSIKGMATSSVAATSSQSQPEQAGAAGLFTFASSPSSPSQPKPKTSNEIAFILVEGHSLILKGNTALEEQFKENLKTSPLFSNNIEDIRTINFETAKGDKNITTFKMEIKLAKPIKK